MAYNPLWAVGTGIGATEAGAKIGQFGQTVLSNGSIVQVWQELKFVDGGSDPTKDRHYTKIMARVLNQDGSVKVEPFAASRGHDSGDNPFVGTGTGTRAVFPKVMELNDPDTGLPNGRFNIVWTEIQLTDLEAKSGNARYSIYDTAGENHFWDYDGNVPLNSAFASDAGYELNISTMGRQFRIGYKHVARVGGDGVYEDRVQQQVAFADIGTGSWIDLGGGRIAKVGVEGSQLIMRIKDYTGKLLSTTTIPVPHVAGMEVSLTKLANGNIAVAWNYSKSGGTINNAVEMKVYTPGGVETYAGVTTIDQTSGSGHQDLRNISVFDMGDGKVGVFFRGYEWSGSEKFHYGYLGAYTYDGKPVYGAPGQYAVNLTTFGGALGTITNLPHVQGLGDGRVSISSLSPDGSTRLTEIYDARREGIDKTAATLHASMMGTQYNDILRGSTGHDTLYGHNGEDVLHGGEGNDSLMGGNDYDILEGGLGADTFDGGAGWNAISYQNASEGVKAVRFDSSLNTGHDAVGDVYHNDTFAALVGSQWSDRLHGWGEAEDIYGGRGDDVIHGYQGNDSLYGEADNDYIDGNLGNDRLFGGSGNDTLLGGSGADFLDGDEGDDYFESSFAVLDEGAIIKGGSGYDMVSYWNSDAAVKVNLAEGKGYSGFAYKDTYESIEKVWGSDKHNDTLIGSGVHEWFHGSGGSDTIQAAGGKDTLNGGSGADYLEGGDGDDLYIVDHGMDLIVEGNSATSGHDQIETFFSFDMSKQALNAEEMWLVGEWIENAQGASLIGNNLGNKITGHQANDALEGREGSDTLNGGKGHDTLNGGTGVDTLDGGIGDDLYYVDDAADLVLDASGYDQVGTTISFDMSKQALNAEEMWLVGEWIENAQGASLIGNNLGNKITGHQANDALEGREGSDTLNGGKGHDTLNGGTGVDTLDGGIGDDLYYVDDAADLVLDASGYDRIETTVSFDMSKQALNAEKIWIVGSFETNGSGVTLVGNNWDNEITGQQGKDSLVGGEGKDKLIGSEGSDTLDGGIGIDTLDGGAGTDIYYVDSGDEIKETALGEIDKAYVTGSFILAAAARVEELYAANASVKVDITGNEFTQSITGGAVADVLAGGRNADPLEGDTLIGGAGNDTYRISNSKDLVIEGNGEGKDVVELSTNSYTLDKDAQVEVILVDKSAMGQSTTIVGNAFTQVIQGSSVADVITANSAAMLAGLGGADTYYINHSGAYIQGDINAAEKNKVYASVNYTLTGGASVELFKAELAEGATTGLWMVGNQEYANSIVGSALADTLDGGKGTLVDTLVGGDGGDTYIVRANTPIIQETGATGTDIVKVLVSNYTLEGGLQIEEIHADTKEGAGTFNLKGNELANTIVGAGGGDVLEGGGVTGGLGQDKLQGKDGNDVYIVDSSLVIVDEVTEGGGLADTVRLTGAASNFTGARYDLAEQVEILDGSGVNGAIDLYGNALGNQITGNTAANSLDGGEGNDILDGGGTAGDAADILKGGSGNDTYTIRRTGDLIEEGMDPITGGNDSAAVHVAKYKLGENIGIELVHAIDIGEGVEFIGNNYSNTLQGNRHNDILDSGSREVKHTLKGLAGNDTYRVRHEQDVIEESVADADYNDVAEVYTAKYDLADNVGVEVLKIGKGFTSGKSALGEDLGAHLIGNNYTVFLEGADFNDTLDGGFAGANHELKGGNGSDVYIIRNADDFIVENAGEGSDTVVLMGDASIYWGGRHVLAANADTLDGSNVTGALNFDGNELANRIIGNVSANVLFGGGGKDTLVGGDGNDQYRVDSDDTIDETDADDHDIAFVMSDYILTAEAKVEELRAEDVNVAYKITGNEWTQKIIGGNRSDILDGGSAGADTLQGGAGDDVYIVDRRDVTVDEVTGGDGLDTVKLTGGAFEGTTYTLAEGADTLDGSGVGGGVTLKGNELSNRIIAGNAGATLDGGAGGEDVLQGGTGNDTYIVDRTTGLTLDESKGGGNDTVTLIGGAFAGTTYELGKDLETLDGSGVGGGVTLKGNELSNRIIAGNAGATLDGGAGGEDVLQGGTGNDTYIVDRTTGLTLDESKGGGNDTVTLIGGAFAGTTYELGKDLETLDGSEAVGALTLKGNELSNRIIASNAGSTLDGRTDGNDTLQGGTGDDTYLVDRLGVSLDEVTNGGGNDIVKLTGDMLAGAAYELASGLDDLDASGVTGSMELKGNTLANAIIGTVHADIILAGIGNDTLDGGGDEDDAADLLSGGTGDDTYRIRHRLDEITESALADSNDANDVAEVYVAEYDLADDIGVEVLKAGKDIGFGVKLIGNNQANQRLQGSNGQNDTLDGGWAGVDHILDGGTGNDTYYIRNAGDEVFDAGGDNDVAYVYTETFGDIEAREAYIEYLQAQGIDKIITAPTHLTLSKLTIHEHAATGSVVGFLSAVDVPSNAITYELVDRADDRFDLVGDALSGYRIVVKNGAKLDFEQALAHGGVYKIKLRASDGDMMSEEVEVEIVVTDTSIESTHGSADSDLIKAGGGADQLGGGQGNDTLHGGLGNDVLTGGDGHDVFVFDTAPDRLGNMDVIRDFAVAGDSSDQIWLALDVFGALSGVAGAALSMGEFHIGARATAAEHRIIYNKVTGALSYDADGSGAGEAVQFAKLSPLLSLTADHFLLTV